MRVFGIDPGSERTGYGCVETDGRRHRLLACGAITARQADAFPARLARIHQELSVLLASLCPECVAIENVFHANNVRSALKLGHARGVAMLAAVEAGCTVVEYTPAEIKRAVVGYGRAEKHQVGQMVKLLLGLAEAPSPHDAADALAVAICHLHSMPRADLKVRLYESRGDESRGDESRGDGSRGDGSLSDVAAGLQTRPKTDVAAGLQTRPKTWRQYRPPTQG